MGLSRGDILACVYMQSANVHAFLSLYILYNICASANANDPWIYHAFSLLTSMQVMILQVAILPVDNSTGRN